MPQTADNTAGEVRARPPALRQRIGRRVLLSLVLIWGLGSAVVLGVGNHFVAQAFDRALLDDAHAVAAHVRQSDRAGGDPLLLDLTAREVGLLRFDQSETVLFAVYGPDGRWVAGDRDLPAGVLGRSPLHAFSHYEHEGLEMRRVTLHIPGEPGFTVVMAQTTAERTQLLRRLLFYSGLAQLWLLVVLGSWLLRGIERDLRPLADLQHAVARRDAADLTPLPPALTCNALASDVQHLGEALDGLLARVQQGLHAQREFAGNVAHELRTPLAGIRAQASRALEHADPQVWRSELEGIAKAEQRASRTVDQLLALARAAESGMGLPMQPIALHKLVRETLLRFLPRADELGVDLGADGLDQEVTVLGNAALLEGILSNLLDNAFRYGRGHPPQVTVSLVVQDGAFAVLSVSDNGPGVDTSLAELVQQRWVQGDQGMRLGQGAGLGLSIVSRYAALLGGGLTLEPAAPDAAVVHGLAARVRLPLALGSDGPDKP